MATTGVNFIVQTVAGLQGGALSTGAVIAAYDHQSALMLTGRGPGGVAYLQPPIASNGKSWMIDDVMTRLDRMTWGKNGGVLLSLSGTTPQTILLTNTTANGPLSTAGDTVFAIWNELVFANLDTPSGTGDVTIQPSSSNGANLLGMTYGTPLTVRVGTSVILASWVGEAVSSSHAGILVTPASSGPSLFALAIGGD